MLAVDHVLSNDEGLIREAGQHGLTCLRVTDLLLLLKSQGLVPAIRPVLDRMIQRDYGIRLDLYEEALRAADEGPGP
jgi:predicted nucleic acid-binding protein